jgi:hypothetical protein
MDTESSPILSLYNVCRGAADEIFKREVDLVIDNIIDNNTDSEQKRSIIMEFEFIPMKDRSGASISMKVKSKLAGVEPVEGTMFLTRRAGEVVAVPYDPRQEELFAEVPQQEKRK